MTFWSHLKRRLHQSSSKPDLINRLSQFSHHEEQIGAYFGGRTRFTGKAQEFDYPLYVMAFVNRSGSNLLGEYLRKTDRFRGFRESLNHQVVLEMSARGGYESFPDYMRHLSRDAAGRNRPLGVKASWEQLMMLMRWRIHKMYPAVRVLHIRRKDTVGQAVSHAIAKQTGQWTSNTAATSKRAPIFNADQIDSFAEAAVFSDWAISHVCTIFDLHRHMVCYEDMVSDPRQVMAQIGDFAGVDFSEWTPPRTALSKQRGVLNEEFRSRYIAQMKKRLRVE
ncbi:MAG: Stf0 family sulfotransferase [Pseudomonadota bacterium]